MPTATKPHTTRRKFLAYGAASVAGALAPAFIPSSALGAGASVSPSNRIVLGLIGMGKMMSYHHRMMLARPEVHVAALCDVESERLALQQTRNHQAYAERLGKPSYKGCQTYSDFRELLARDDIDAVIIATPNHWHAIPTVEALRAGKDVYCEKPLARTIEEGQIVARTAQSYGRILQVGSQQRSEAGFRRACELVRNGHIGRVRTVYVNVGGPPVDCYLPEEPIPKGLDWEFWLGPAPWRPYHSDIAPGLSAQGWPNWRSYRDYAGGAMTDWGAHHFDIAQWGLGRDKSGPFEIYPPNGREVRRLTYVYDDGVTLVHGVGSDDRAGVEFVGTEGRIMVNRGYLRADPPDLLARPVGAGGQRLYESPGHHQNWLDSIRSRRQPICPADIGHRSATVCHLGNIAYWLKRPLKWNPNTERFVRDEEANRLLARPMRSPWRI